jgi:hypothetical protein
MVGRRRRQLIRIKEGNGISHRYPEEGAFAFSVSIFLRTRS